jgi:hypothetical protein
MFFPLESAHHAHVVQVLYGLNFLTMVEPFFVLLCKSLYFARHNVHFQVSVEVIISNVPVCIDNVPEYFVLESLYIVSISLFGATPDLDTTCPNGFQYLYRSLL